MRVSGIVVAVLVAATGVVFAGQGLGYIPGSFMSGDIHWFWIGSALIVGAGVVAAAAILTSRRSA